MRGRSFWLEAQDGISSGFFSGFLAHHFGLQGPVDGVGTAEFVVTFLPFSKASGLVFGVIVGPGEVFVFQKATGLFQGVSRQFL